MSELNRRIAEAQSNTNDEPTLNRISRTIQRFTEHLANRGNWKKCGFVPRKQNGTTEAASKVQANGVVEYSEVKNPVGDRRGFILPDIRLSKVLTIAHELGSRESFYLSEDGLLCHYDLKTGTATPCLEIDDRFAFREKYAVPFRGDVVGWDELEEGIKKSGTGRG